MYEKGPQPDNMTNFEYNETLVNHTIKDKEIYVPVEDGMCVTQTYAKTATTNHINKIANFIPKANISFLDRISLDNYYKNSHMVKILHKDMLSANDKVAEEFKVKAFFCGIFQTYFKLEEGLLACSENKTGTGQIYFSIKYTHPNISLKNVAGAELKALKGDSWGKGLSQTGKYGAFDNTVENPYLMFIKGDQIAFFFFLSTKKIGTLIMVLC